MTSSNIVFNGQHDPLLLFGEEDRNIRLLERELLVLIYPKNNQVRIEGEKENVLLAQEALEFLFRESQKGIAWQPPDLERMLHSWKQLPKKNQEQKDQSKAIWNSLSEEYLFFAKKNKRIYPKALNQLDYLKAIREKDLVFAVGPAGTGKTYLAVAMGLQALLEDRVQRLILTRPVVEAGENLGFLPGDLEQKVHPYLRPLLDAVYDFIPYEDFLNYRARDRIEIAPLAYMRGRTLNDAFTILDEAQNTTQTQMKMFLTRLGKNSQSVVTGDITQIDLSPVSSSGLVLAEKILTVIPEIAWVHFDQSDIIRHTLVRKILHAFEHESPKNSES